MERKHLETIIYVTRTGRQHRGEELYKVVHFCICNEPKESIVRATQSAAGITFTNPQPHRQCAERRRLLEERNASSHS